MSYYPISLNLKEKNCLVVGGGSVGKRKIQGLVAAGARVRVVSKEFSEPFGAAGEIILEKRAYAKGDVDGMFLVFAATDDSRKNQEIVQDAKNAGILVCVADAPDEGDFIVPAAARQGDLVCTVSTSGTSPALAKKIREELESTYGPEYNIFLELMKKIRQDMLRRGKDSDTHREVFTDLVRSDLIEIIARGDMDAVNERVSQILGKDMS